MQFSKAKKSRGIDMFFLDPAKYYKKMPTHHTGFISKTIVF